MKKYDIPKHRRGDTWVGISSFPLTVNGIPVNLTNAAIKIDFKKQVDSPVALTLSTAASSIVITQPTQGIFSIPARIINIPFGLYLYDVQVTFSSGIITTYVEGAWEIVADITE